MPVSSPDLLNLLDAVSVELEAGRGACFLLDADLRVHWVSPEMHAMMRADATELGYGLHLVAALALPGWSRRVTRESLERASARLLPYTLFHAQAAGSEMLAELERRASEAGVDAAVPPAIWTGTWNYLGDDGSVVPSRYSATLLGHPSAGWIGCAVAIGSPLRATVLDLLTRGDEQLFERIASLATPRQEPAAVLFMDMEDSTALSRRLSTSGYFRLISTVLTRADAEIADRDGVVGKHAGDGATAFFRASDAGSASRAARNAVETALALQSGVAAMPHDPPLRLNIGLHFAPRLYLGQLITSGRLEVTALGDEVNEAARIQECSRGGTILASKLLLEQLDPEDAAAVGLSPDDAVYGALGDWPTCTDKARRDAGLLPVTPLTAGRA